MNNTMIKISLLGATLLLSACASTPAKSPEASTAKVAASYFEKIDAKALSAYAAGECPKTSVEQLDWKRLVPMASACVKTGEWSRVEQLGNQLSVKGSLTPWGPYFLSLSAEARKDYPRAQWMLELALKKAPKEGILHYQLGRVHWANGDDIKAIEHLQKASDLNPSLTEAHWIAGVVYMNSDKFSQAENAFNRALQNDSRHLPTVLSMADLKVKTKSWEEAEKYLDKAISMNPRALKPRLALATVQEMYLKNMQAALSTYKDIRRMASSNRLDESAPLNIEDKIKSIESAIVASSRQPAAGKVKK